MNLKYYENLGSWEPSEPRFVGFDMFGSKENCTFVTGVFISDAV